ncbi:MAG: magnesium transporter [candidate division WOR-3 bacterium]
MPKFKYSPLVQLVMPEIKEAINEKKWHVLKDFISTWEPVDIVELFKELNPEDVLIIFLLLPTRVQSAIFAKFDAVTQEKILKSLNEQQVRQIVSEIKPDDRTELFEELPSELIHKFLNILSPDDRKEVLQLLAYPKDSVGRLLTPDYVAVKPSWTISETMEYIRKYGKDAETINVVYVIDDNGKLLDDIPIRKLILAEPNQTIESIMDRSYISINAYADQEEAAKVMQKYDLISLPVTNAEGQLLGIVTIDDIIDVLQEEQTEDFTKLSAIATKPIKVDFITKIKEVPLQKLYRSRVTWLLALLIMDLITGSIIQGFQETIARYVVLVTFLPVLVDTAGNAGAQSATLVIRAMALGTIQMRDWLKLLGRELFVAGALGITMGLGISIMGIIRGRSFNIASVVVIAMIVNVVVGSLIGILLPFIFTRFKKDPATASTPLITTLADIIGTGIYLGIAYLMLH